MNINAFAKRIAELESGKEEINIAQIKEFLRIINELSAGVLYAWARTLK